MPKKVHFYGIFEPFMATSKEDVCRTGWSASWEESTSKPSMLIKMRERHYNWLGRRSLCNWTNLLVISSEKLHERASTLASIRKLSPTLKLWKFPSHYSTQPGPGRRRSCEPSELVLHLWILLLIFPPTEFRPKIDFELRGEVFQMVSVLPAIQRCFLVDNFICLSDVLKALKFIN